MSRATQPKSSNQRKAKRSSHGSQPHAGFKAKRPRKFKSTQPR